MAGKGKYSSLLALFILIQFITFTAAQKEEDGKGRVKWKGTGKNITYYHEVWHPIQFPAVDTDVVNVALQDEDGEEEKDNAEEETPDVTCSGRCGALASDLDYTLSEVQDLLTFETITDDGNSKTTQVKPDDSFVAYLNDWYAEERNLAANISEARENAHSRRRRSVLGSDSRFPIDDRRYVAKEPFSAAVKLSTGCSGVLIGELYVLTAARCIHNGKRFVVPLRQLNVGFRRNRSLKPEVIGTSEWEKALIWIRVAQAFLPIRWTQHRRTRDLPLDEDYAVLLLKRSPDRPYLNISVGSDVNVAAGSQLHMNALDSPNNAELFYRFCFVEGETQELFYQHCDGDADAMGAGIYVRRWDGTHRGWVRKVIGIYSGEQEYVQDGQRVVNNVALRITPLKFAQICYWLTGDYNGCNG